MSIYSGLGNFILQLQDVGEAKYAYQTITPTPHHFNSYTVNGPAFDGEEFDDLESAVEAIRVRCVQQTETAT